MISFLRKIRQKLLTQNKITSYLTYAVGEILLVVLGILIALQVNNWNEERKRQENFLATIEQIYNSLELETQTLYSLINNLSTQQKFAQILFDHPDSLELEEVPGILFYIETEPDNFRSSIGFHLQKLTVNPKDNNENLLARNLNNYLAKSSLEFLSKEKPISTILIQEGLPAPSLNFGYSMQMGITNFTGLFQKEEQEKARALLPSQEIRSSLVQLAQRKEYEKTELGNLLEQGIHCMEQIRESYPNVRLLYQNIGVVGVGTSNENWTDDLPLMLIDKDKSIWESQVTLKKGRIKFRENKSWIANWGGLTFPKGNLEWFGPDIPSEAGDYKLIVDMTAKTYEFIPISK